MQYLQRRRISQLIVGWGDDISKDFQEEVAYYVLGKQKGVNKSFQVKKKKGENVLCGNVESPMEGLAHVAAYKHEKE